MNEKSMIKCNTKLKLELICYPASSPLTLRPTDSPSHQPMSTQAALARSRVVAATGGEDGGFGGGYWNFRRRS